MRRESGRSRPCVPNRSMAWGVAEKSKCISSEEEAGEGHRGGGPSGRESPTGRGNEKASGGGECEGVVGEG